MSTSTAELLPARVVNAVLDRLPQAGLDERDPDAIRERLPALWLLSSFWFRSEVRGLGNVPEDGGVLLVGNHSGGNSTPDTLVLTLAFSTYFGVERPFYTLVDNVVPTRLLRGLGRLGATAGNARRALQAGAAVLMYPGGRDEAHRPWTQRNRIEFGPSREFLQIALEEDVPLVPVVSIGGHETALFLGRGETLARLVGLRRLPLSIALPWGLNIGDLLGHLPLPAKITIDVLPPIDLRRDFGPDVDLDEAHDHVLRLMQETLDALAAERRLPVIG